MHQDLIRQLDEAVAEVFAVMLNLACAAEPGGPATAAAPDSTPLLAASILISGSLRGCCCLQMDMPAATELTANLTGAAPDEIPLALCADAAGEICNMIAGCWKKRHPGHCAASQLSCPTVGMGSCLNCSEGFHHEAMQLYRCSGLYFIVRLAFN